MSDRVITRPKDGYQFRLVGSHTSTAPVGQEPTRHLNCPGRGTAQQSGAK